MRHRPRTFSADHGAAGPSWGSRAVRPNPRPHAAARGMGFPPRRRRGRAHESALADLDSRKGSRDLHRAVARDAGFARPISRARALQCQHTYKPLAAGTYFWRYRFADKAGKQSGWSQVRRFSVGSEAIEFPMPSRAEQAQRVPRQHPRLFLRPEELPRLARPMPRRRPRRHRKDNADAPAQK